MNWTEGSLARHSRKRGLNPEKTRQKEYFAKARKRSRSQHVPTGTAGGSRPYPSSVTGSRPTETSSVAHNYVAVEPATKRQTTLPRDYNQHTVGHRGEKASLPTQDCPSRPLRPLSYEPDGNELTAKRRRLLETSDWTGLHSQKPMTLTLKSKPTAVKPTAVAHTNDKRGHRSRHRRSGAARDNENIRISRQHKGTKHSPCHTTADDQIVLRIDGQNMRWSQDGQSVRVAPSATAVPSLEKPPSSQGFRSTPPGSVSQSSFSTLSTRKAIVRSSRSTRKTRARASAKHMTKRHEPSSGHNRKAPPSSPEILRPIPVHKIKSGRFRQSIACNQESPDVRSTIAEIGGSTTKNSPADQIDEDWALFLQDMCSATSEPALPRLPQLYHKDTTTTILDAKVSLDDRRHEAPDGSGNFLAKDVYREPLSSSQEAQPNDVEELWLKLMCGTESAAPGEEIQQHDHKEPCNICPLCGPGLITFDPADDAQELWQRFLDDDTSEVKAKAHATRREAQESICSTPSDAQSILAEPPLTEKSSMPGSFLDAANVPDSPPMVSSIQDAHISEEPQSMSINLTSTSENQCHTSDSRMADSGSFADESGHNSIGEEVIMGGNPLQDSESDNLLHDWASATDPSTSTFRLRRPQQFVGRLAPQNNAHLLKKPTIRPGIQDKRVKKKWKSDRPNIRAVPNFDDDPIADDD